MIRSNTNRLRESDNAAKMTEKYPLDFDALNKGHTIPAETLIDIFGMPPADQRFRFKCLALCQQIASQLERRFIHATVCQVQDGIRILTDSEATVYNERQGLIGQRKVKRAFKRLRNVEIANLSPAERDAHEKRLLLLGRLNHGVTHAKLPELKSHQSLMRETGLISKST